MDSYLRPLMSALLLERVKTNRLANMRVVLDELMPEKNLRFGLERYIEEQFENEHSIIVSQLRDEITDAIRRLTTEERSSLLSSIREQLNDSFAILSLSEVPDSILMWSHYAESHKGFVLELDATDPFFDQKTFPNDSLRCVHKVLYEHDRPSQAHFETKYWLRTRKDASKDLLEYMAGVLLLTKSSDWAYEQEWRMVIPLASARKVDAGIHVLDLPPHCILRVIVGSAMSDNDLKCIFEILEHPDYFHVEVRRAVCDTQRFRVVLKDDESIVENKLLQDIEQFPNNGILQRIDRLQVTRPRYYEVQAALVDKGWISIPPYNRLIQKKKALALTEAGRARLAKRHEAERIWEESRKSKTKAESCESDTTRLLEKLAGASPDQIRSIIMDDLAESLERMNLREQEKPERQRMEPEVRRYFAALGNEDEHVSWQAAKALRKVGDANVVEHLISILNWRQNEDLAAIHDPRQRLAFTEDEIDDIESDAPVAYWLLSDRELWGSDELTMLAAYALAGIAARVTADEATDVLIDALREPDSGTRYCAAEALGQIASAHALPELERLAKNDDEETTFGIVADAARVAIQRVKEAHKRGRARI
jgi:hypothetical protein